MTLNLNLLLEMIIYWARTHQEAYRASTSAHSMIRSTMGHIGKDGKIHNEVRRSYL